MMSSMSVLAASGCFAGEREGPWHEPAAPHHTVDNRLTAAVTLEDQIARLAAGASGRR